MFRIEFCKTAYGNAKTWAVVYVCPSFYSEWWSAYTYTTVDIKCICRNLS